MMKHFIRWGHVLSARNILSLTVAAAMLSSGHARAVDATWNGTTSAAWATGTNWSATPVPGTGDTATFNNAGNANTTIDLGGGVTVKTITFDTSAAAAYTLGLGAVNGQTLTLNNTGGITLSSTVKSNELVNAAVTLGTDGTSSSFTLTNSSSALLTIKGALTGTASGGNTKTLTTNITGTGNIIFGDGTGGVTGSSIADGAGGGKVALVVNNTGGGVTMLNLFNANTYSGGAFIQAGTLIDVKGNTTAFGTSGVTLGVSGGSAATTLVGLNQNYANPITVAGNDSGAATISWNGNATFSGAITLGDANGGHDLTLFGNSGNTTAFTGAFSTFGATTGNLTLDGFQGVSLTGVGGQINPKGTITAQSKIYGTGTGTGTNRISGVIGNNVLGVIQNSPSNVLNLLGANAYTTATTIQRGTVQLGNGTTGSLNATAGTDLTFNGTGAFIVSEANNVSQGMKILTVSHGEATIQSTNNGGNSFLTFASMAARGAGATENFVTSGGGSATNKIALTTTTNAPLTTGSNNAGIFFGGNNYARYSITNSTFQAVVYTGTPDTNASQVANGGGTVAAGPATLGSVTGVSDVKFLGGQAVAAGQSSAVGPGTNSMTLTVSAGQGSRFTVGAAVTGTGITANTWITDINTDTLTLSRPSTWANGAPIRPDYLVTAQTTADVNTLNLNGRGASIRLVAGQTLGINGILANGGTNGDVDVISGATGSFIQAATSGGEIVVRNNTTSDRVEINTIIQNNSTASRLTTSGPGQTILTGTNTYTGTTTINAGILTAENAQALGVGGNITFSSGVATAIGGLTTSGLLQYTNLSTGQDYSARFKNSTGAIVLDANGVTNTVNLLNTIDSSNTGGLVLMSNASGNASFTIGQVGGGNTYTGETWLFGANTGTMTVNINNNTAFGSGLIYFRNQNTAPTIDAAVAGLSLANAQIWSSDFGFAGTNNLTMTGPVTTDGNRIVSVATKTLTVSGAIGESGTGRSIIKAGAGTLVLSGANSYTGVTTIQAGTLSINAIKSLSGGTNGGPSAVGNPGSIANGTIAIGTTTTGAALVYTGTGDTTDRVINLAGTTGGATIDQSGTGLLKFTSNLTATVAGIKTLSLQGSTAGAGELDGAVVNSSGNATSLIKDGTGTWILAGSNSYTGQTTISGGTLQIGNGGTGGTLNTGSAIVDNATLAFNRSNTITQGTNFNNVISGSGALVQMGTGTTVLTTGLNTYTGKTSIQNGILSAASLNNVSGGSVNSNLGAPITVANGTIDFGAATTTGQLTYTGTGQTTDRVINLAGTTGGAVISQSGTGLLKFTSANSATGAGSKTLTLQGSTAGTGEIDGAIVNNSGANVTSLTKTGTSTWTLGNANVAANTYTGLTTVGQGVLILNKAAGTNAIAGDGSTGTTDVSISGGTLRWSANNQVADNVTVDMSTGAFELNGRTETLYRLTNAGGTFSTGVGGQLIGTGASVVWSGGTNTINADGSVTDAHVSITGGTNTVQGAAGPPSGTLGGVLHVQTGGVGLEMTGATLTLNSDATSAGKLLLDGDVTTFGSATTSTIANGGAAAIIGTVDLDAGTRTFTVANGAALVDMSISAGITNGALTKDGAGRMELSAANSYGGNTDIVNGTLAMTGSGTIDNSPKIIVRSGAQFDVTGTGGYDLAIGQTLAGSGTVLGDLTIGVGSTLSPGDTTGPGLLSFGSLSDTLTWDDGGSYLWEINDATGVAGGPLGWDFVSILGNLDITSTITPFTVNITGPAANFVDSNAFWTIATAGNISGFNPGNFNLLDNFSTPHSGTFSIVQSGNNVNIVYTAGGGGPVSATPEPSTVVLALLGLASLGGVALRRRRRV